MILPIHTVIRWGRSEKKSTNAKKTAECMDKLKVADAMDCIWGIVNRANKYIDETMPWDFMGTLVINNGGTGATTAAGTQSDLGYRVYANTGFHRRIYGN